MTTYYPFTPSNVGPPSFTPTFDGSQYQVSVVWNLFGKRYYVQCVDLQGATVYNQALIESDVGIAIESLAWESLTSQVNGVTGDAHGYPLGETVALTVNGAAPVVYNGMFAVLITGPDTFSYPVTFDADPGPATVPGTLSYDINMNGAYFTSSLVFRNGNFEVSP